MIVRRVLEFGSGSYSTHTFLDRAAFPDLTQIDSFETDPVWLDELKGTADGDPRLRMHLIEGPMASAVPRIALDQYDLIFIDDSTDELSRATTIGEVAARAGRSSVVVIHDFETGSYRKAASRFPRRFAFTALNPNTGVCWSAARLSRFRLRALNGLVRKHARYVVPHDRRTWVDLLTPGHAN
jgi:predicted O-methyltransferase YrrM